MARPRHSRCTLDELSAMPRHAHRRHGAPHHLSLGLFARGWWDDGASDWPNWFDGPPPNFH